MEIYYLPQDIPHGISGYYSVDYLPSEEVLPQHQKADNIFNECLIGQRFAVGHPLRDMVES